MSQNFLKMRLVVRSHSSASNGSGLHRVSYLIAVRIYQIENRFLLLEGRHRKELIDIVDPEDMGGTDLAHQIVPLRVVAGLGGQGLVMVIVLVPLRVVHVLLRDRWTVAGKCTRHTAQAVCRLGLGG